MIKHSFVKEMTPVAKGAMDKVFGELEPVSKMEVSRYELPIQSIRRSMGDKFWDLSNSQDDILDVVIDDEGVFSPEVIALNPKCGNNIVTFIMTLVNTFIAMNHNKIEFSDEELNNKCVRFSVTREKDGLSQMMVSLNDFKDIIEIDSSNRISGLIHYKELDNITAEIQKQQEIYQKIANIDNNKAMEISTKIADLLQEMSNYNVDIAKKFFNLVLKLTYGDDSDISDVFDMQILASMEIYDDQNPEAKPIRQSILTVYHECTAHDIREVREKFFY